MCYSLFKILFLPLRFLSSCPSSVKSRFLWSTTIAFLIYRFFLLSFGSLQLLQGLWATFLNNALLTSHSFRFKSMSWWVCSCAKLFPFSDDALNSALRDIL
ncbi:hypothetical protein XENOCAPTIV_010493 [Xenoophorus captivus]|uniref:Uncharacterized protein n=1 Tax=Xenoophorus captivus TaxID=1517983 RepID=A0ABV0SC33_9TELE